MRTDESLIEAPVIVIGPGRSGSTLLSEIVFVHESLAWPSNYSEWRPAIEWHNHLRRLTDNRFWQLSGEKAQLNRTRALNNLIPRPAEAYPFWEHLTDDEIDFSRGFLLNETASDESRERIRATFSRLVARQGRERLSMKLTGPGRIGFLQSIFPDARFINVVRNPATMVNSFINVDFWRDSGMDKLWWTGGYNGEELKEFERIRHDPIAATAFQLAKVVKTTEEEAEAVGAEMLTIDYDDFLNNPRLGVSAMLQHARLDDSDRVWDKLASLKLHGGSGRHRDLSDEQYETVMSMFANSAGYA